MKSLKHNCTLSRRQLIDEYFIENRTKLLDIAAFLDRLDRVGDDVSESDFRIEAFQESLKILCEPSLRVVQIQMLLSDPTLAPLEKLDQKSARGAYEPTPREPR
jgi:hypothetical protein